MSNDVVFLRRARRGSSTKMGKRTAGGGDDAASRGAGRVFGFPICSSIGRSVGGVVGQVGSLVRCTWSGSRIEPRAVDDWLRGMDIKWQNT